MYYVFGKSSLSIRVIVFSLSLTLCLASPRRQLLERVNGTHKMEFENKLHSGVLPLILCVPKGKQVRCLGTERLLALNREVNVKFINRNV